MATMRVLTINKNGETIRPCLRATRNKEGVWIEYQENCIHVETEGEVLVLGDNGHCVHRWMLDGISEPVTA